MPFITDFSKDPYARRLVILLYGAPKVGKTTCLLNLVADKDPKEAPRLYMISADRGAKQLAMNDHRYKGKMAIAYVSSMREARADFNELSKRVQNLIDKGYKPWNIWVAIDTVTHLQVNLLTEARRMEVSRTDGKAKISEDQYVREILTRVDFNVNLTQMAELTNQALKLPVNIVFVALEKTEENAMGKKTQVPALSGQSAAKIIGDADIVARMVVQNDERMLLIRTEQGYHGGDRTGLLEAEEPPDLLAIQEKFLGVQHAPVEEPMLPPQPANNTEKEEERQEEIVSTAS